MATPRRTRSRQTLTEIRARTRAISHHFYQHARTAFAAYPKLAIAAGVVVLAGVLVGLVPDRDGPERTSQVAALDLHAGNEPVIDEAAAPETVVVDAEAAIMAAEVALDIEEPTTDIDAWTIVEVRPGQTLDRIFRELGLSARVLHDVVNASNETRALARIRPGDEFAFHIDEGDGLLALRTEFDEESWLFVERNGDGFETRTEPRALERRLVETRGTISTSLYRAANQSGLSDNLTMRLANIFGWDIDFALEIRSGDRFALIYEQIWRDGEFLRDGPILAARFVNQGETFEAIRFDAGNGPDYFSPDGRPMRQAFLRAPLNFTRVTSNFNPRRFHPITRQVRPHNGTDYGAPTGTPVWAAGDGRVTRSGYNNRNGNYIFVQHGNHIETRYLHLSRRAVKVGDRVRQGQTIGHVGATGMATGPHLHYEFLVNGAHRNPRTVDLPPADPLPAEFLDEFKQIGSGLITQLDDIDQPELLLASTESGCEQSESVAC